MHKVMVALALLGVLSTPAGGQNSRARWIGPEIARGATFTVHTTGAEPRGATYACPKELQTNQVVQTVADQDAIWRRRSDYVQQRRGALDEEHRLKWAENQRQVRELPARLRRGEITRDDFQKRYDALVAEQKSLNAQRDAGVRTLQGEAEQHFPFHTGGAVLTLTLQHTPRSPQDLVIPLSGRDPAPSFTDALNTSLAPFLATCGSMSTVIVLHYYRDAERRGAEGGKEKEVLRSLYSLQNKRLVLQPGRPESADNPFKLATHDDMTLAGFRAQDARIRRINADYRTDFEYASRRKAGVVYKYDAFWRQFPDFEIARRIFDGDFEDYVNTIDFTFLYTNYGGRFTSRCRAHVKELRRIHYPTRTYEGGEINPDDLSFEPNYRDGSGSFEVDSRFADRIPEYLHEQAKYMLKNWLDKQKRGERLSWTVDGLRNGVLDIWAQGKVPPMLTFFEATACTSPVMEQLGINIHRAASGLPSLQAAGLRIPGAESASDAPTKR